MEIKLGLSITVWLLQVRLVIEDSFEYELVCMIQDRDQIRQSESDCMTFNIFQENIKFQSIYDMEQDQLTLKCQELGLG